MKVLSLTQPWATLMARGEKTIETRSRPNRTLVGQQLAIASTLERSSMVRETCAREPYRSVLARHGLESWRQLPYGQILCHARIVAVMPTGALPIVGGRLQLPPGWTTCGAALAPEELHFGNYSRGRFAYLTAPRTLVRIRPVEAAQCMCGRAGPRGERCGCGETFTGRAAGAQSTWEIDDRFLIPEG